MTWEDLCQFEQRINSMKKRIAVFKRKAGERPEKFLILVRVFRMDQILEIRVRFAATDDKIQSVLLAVPDLGVLQQSTES